MMRPMRPALFLALALACRAPEVGSSSPQPGADGGGFGFQVAEAGAGEGPPGQSCAFQSFVAERLPLDLLVLVDASGSMAEPVPGTGRSKWQMAEEALAAFVTDRSSEGLGIGLQFFPLVGPGTPCAAPGDCGDTTGPSGICAQRQLCVGAGQPLASAPPCGPGTAACAPGTTCQAIGTCAASGAACSNLGGACPAGDSCRME